MPWNSDLEVEDLPSFLRQGSTSSGCSDSLQTLHPNNCPDCQAYKVHVIHTALEGGNSPWTGYPESSLGSSPERILNELYQVRTHLRRVRGERDEAIALNARYRTEVARMESQLREAKDQLSAIELAYSDENQTWDPGFLAEESQGGGLLRGEAGVDSFETSSPRNDILGTNHGVDGWETDYSITQTDSFPSASWSESSDSDDFDIFQQLHVIIQEDQNPWQDNHALQHPLVTNTTQEVYNAESSSDAPSTPSLSSISTDDWAGNQSDDSSSSSERPTSSNQELHDTLKMMASAHEEGNASALSKIKKLIALSERTPRHERTEAQKYLLLNWRSPSRNNLASPQLHPAPPISSSSQGQEIFVDASGSGIGFVFGTKWLAWTFKRTQQIPLGGDGKIVMSWAELLAVEVGLRSLIAAGYQSTTITLRSDNTGVIDALKKQSWCSRHGIEEILQNILNLCGEYQIELRPRWVSTKDNPADKPSRGVFPPRSLSFQFPPKLPKRLSKLLVLAVPEMA